ncbi:hypothetical protein E4U28_004494 [Claviceps purpurea]|nr:hypothetical protein E4U28_004494 [Claviceps purpurea]
MQGKCSAYLTIRQVVTVVVYEDINDIYTGKFEPWNIIRLHPLRSTRATDDEVASNVDLTSGTLVLKNKVHTIQEYLCNPAIYFSAFANYQYASSVKSTRTWMSPKTGFSRSSCRSHKPGRSTTQPPGPTTPRFKSRIFSQISRAFHAQSTQKRQRSDTAGASTST